MQSIYRLTRTRLTLPDNANIRVLAVSVAEENPEVKPAQPLYDVLGAIASGRAGYHQE